MRKGLRFRKWFHEVRGHRVIRSVDKFPVMSSTGQFGFHFVPCYLCIKCQKTWR